MSTTPSEKQLADVLSQVPLFARSTKKQLRNLSKLGKVQTWKKDREALTQGSKGAAFFLILDGAVDIVRDGNRIARLGAGDFVGEMALLTGEARNASAIAAADSRVFALGRPAFAAAVKADPTLGLTLLEAVAMRSQAV